MENIYAPKGTKVKATFRKEDGEVIHGTDADKGFVKHHLRPDLVYTVDRTVVHNWITEVYLEEFPNKSFNSVNLIEV